MPVEDLTTYQPPCDRKFHEPNRPIRGDILTMKGCWKHRCYSCSALSRNRNFPSAFVLWNEAESGIRIGMPRNDRVQETLSCRFHLCIVLGNCSNRLWKRIEFHLGIP